MGGICARFELQARRTPTAPAVVGAGERLTYAGLDARASAVAARLTSAGVAPGDVVAVVMERSPDLVVALLAVLKAGGTYLPLDLGEPPPRLAAMIADATPVLALCDGPGLTVADGLLPTMRCEAADAATFAGLDGDLAYLAYTSGSTGAPKAVMVDHRNVLNLVTDPNYVTITPTDRVLQFAPAAFDAATFEIWAPLLAGACVVVAPPWLLSAADVAGFVREHGVTVAWLTAALFHRQVDEAPSMFEGMHTVLAGGQALSAPHVRALRSLAPGCRIVNGYGPTECTTFTCCHQVGPDEELAGSVPIGRPVQNVTVHVLDALGRPVPPGAEGELHIGGAGVARGYWRRPALTATRFVPDPFTAGGRLYRSGDVVRRLPDGALEFLGRDDDQFKLRGHRIEPGEIENVLTSHAQIRQAAVVLDRDADEPRLVAYVVAAGPAPVNTRELRRYTLARLPKHMVPAAFLPRAELPLTRNGKTDRKALLST